MSQKDLYTHIHMYFIVVQRGGALVNSRTPKVAVYTKYCVYLCHLHNRYLFCSPGCLSILKNSEMESAASGSDSDSVISCHLQLDALLRGTCVIVWTLESLEDNKKMWPKNKHGWGT